MLASPGFGPAKARFLLEAGSGFLGSVGAGGNLGVSEIKGTCLGSLFSGNFGGLYDGPPVFLNSRLQEFRTDLRSFGALRGFQSFGDVGVRDVHNMLGLGLQGYFRV